ncbi:MAG: signal recognition particle protein Srp54 [Desulfurococcales archaeon]|nr:signal recognition particle protein Srp54 [Desulfurococcales archaeon]
MVLEGLREAVARFLKGEGTYEAAVKQFTRDLQRELIKADVNVRLVFELTKRISERARREEPPPGASRREWFIKIVYEELVKLFGGDREENPLPPKTPWIILLVGVQGSGKTTTAGKLALYYARRGYRVGLVSTDTYRPAAYEQLERLAREAGALFYGMKSGEPEEIARRGVEELLRRGADIIIIDTAGRHGYGGEKALLDEMRRIADAVKPDEVVLVIDAAIGQRAYSLAKRFHESTPIGSIIVTKLDGTARGGGVLTAVAATGARVKFIGTGEKIDEIEPFRPARFIGRILGMGDIESLIEKMKALEEAEKLEKEAREILKGKVTMRTIYHQLISLRKLGPLSKVLEMLPGLGLLSAQGRIKEYLKVGEEKIDRWIAIINSMTYEELDNPEIIDRRRIRRIALGSGARPEDVRELLAYYKNFKTMMRRLRRDKRLLKRLGLDGVEI